MSGERLRGYRMIDEEAIGRRACVARSGLVCLCLALGSCSIGICSCTCIETWDNYPGHHADQIHLLGSGNNFPGTLQDWARAEFAVMSALELLSIEIDSPEIVAIAKQNRGTWSTMEDLFDDEFYRNAATGPFVEGVARWRALLSGILGNLRISVDGGVLNLLQGVYPGVGGTLCFFYVLAPGTHSLEVDWRGAKAVSSFVVALRIEGIVHTRTVDGDRVYGFSKSAACVARVNLREEGPHIFLVDSRSHGMYEDMHWNPWIISMSKWDRVQCDAPLDDTRPKPRWTSSRSTPSARGNERGH